MHVSTVVTRTAAGSAELAAPAHGLSLVQRRFLTLLDTACSLAELASRQRADPAKVERDLVRLASLGLVVCVSPAANDDDAVIAANDATASDAGPSLGAVRLGTSASSRVRLVLVPLAAVVLGLVAWHFLSSSAAPVAAPDAVPVPVPRATSQDVPATPQPIATRVLIDPSAPKSRDTKESQKPKATNAPATGAADVAARSAPPATSPPPLPALRPIETRVAAPQPLLAVPLALPVERRSPPPPASPAPASQQDTREASAPVHVASAAPPVVAAAPARQLVPIAQEPPAFPREAIAAGLASGNVKARIVVDAQGAVGSVEIVDTSHRAFDRAVRDALSHWRFEPGSASRTTTVDIAFKRD